MTQMMRAATLAALLACAGALNVAPRPSFKTAQDVAMRSALATTLALALNSATPAITMADAPSLALERASVTVSDMTAQEKFLAERAKMKTQYEQDVEGTYMTAEETKEKKATYLTVVYGLIAIAFIAPMIQFFYYTGVLSRCSICFRVRLSGRQPPLWHESFPLARMTALGFTLL
eukprot:scaffold85569_cov27-Tisochrysis_lutea.AAC.1